MAEMAAREHGQIHHVQQTKQNYSIHLWRQYLWSECQRVGSWCQHIRFESKDQN